MSDHLGHQQIVATANTTKRKRRQFALCLTCRVVLSEVETVGGGAKAAQGRAKAERGIGT